MYLLQNSPVDFPNTDNVRLNLQALLRLFWAPATHLQSVALKVGQQMGIAHLDLVCVVYSRKYFVFGGICLF